MTDRYKPSTLKFSLDEVVTFRKGDEIAELISLSLEPNVTIQELDHYISIRGSLDMNGEYKKSEEKLEDDEDHFSFSGQKYAAVSETREEGVCDFYYDFPVDITIPKTRIQSLEELNISIDSFDYTLTDNSSLKLTTDLSISGVYEEDFTVEEREEEDVYEEFFSHETLYTTPTNEEDTLTPFQDFDLDSREENEEVTFTAEAKKVESQKEQEEEDIHVPIHVLYTKGDELVELDLRKEETDHTSIEEDTIAAPTLKEEQSLPIDEAQEQFTSSRAETTIPSDAFEQDDVQEENSEPIVETVPFYSADEATFEEEEAEEENEEWEDFDTVHLERKEELHSVELDMRSAEEVDEAVSVLDTENESVRNQKSINYQPQVQKETEEHTISLTKYFARKEEHDRAAKMKIYIVQQEDTLQLIAEKYDLSVSQILRMNRLEAHQDVYEGQVLYIPTKSEKSYS
ncbi:LysM peptidoglycan-binding domain-containing protein [Caldibacillus lycopersici]|uniref:LysM peptidoglycan-binding domain-containing protein n=1 Tax=Perspicuibacillus lycopersici TaxID=1325689 RepID=A0AAE3ISY6_9BACI|nr:LysM peptidoglycan-binding domain-containing protein [Perspicuibacillus lycopersici]MCU9614033.1 LysM peptidoglycan-binding domain-containing protein [Perspicuibacillus lycopersici]